MALAMPLSQVSRVLQAWMKRGLGRGGVEDVAGFGGEVDTAEGWTVIGMALGGYCCCCPSPRFLFLGRDSGLFLSSLDGLLDVESSLLGLVSSLST